MIRIIGILGVILLITKNLPAQVFQELSVPLGVNVEYGTSLLAGGGISFVDFNGDGWDDLTFASQQGDSLHFFINNQNGFTKIPALVNHTDEVKQVLWVDYDNDGDKDLFIACHDCPNRMYENQGNLTFIDQTSNLNLPINNANTFGATFGDYDKDGYLDLFISNRDFFHSNALYKNIGGGNFHNITADVGILDSLKWTFCAAFLDIDKNGWQDIYTIEDKYSMTNEMHKNLGNGTFVNIAHTTGTDITADAMNAGVGDYDNDGDLDIYITNTPLGNYLLNNDGTGNFTNVAVATGVVMNQASWGGIFVDYDNDLDLDLFVCSSDDVGHNNLYENDGTGNFTEPLSNPMTGDTIKSFCTTYGDYNNDGKLDIIVGSKSPDKAKFWKNQSSTGNWFKVKLEGTTSNRDGIGSWIEVYLNGQKYTRYTHCGESFLGQPSDYKHFGLGSHTIIDSVVVRWLSGQVDVLPNIAINQTIKIIEGGTDNFQFLLRNNMKLKMLLFKLNLFFQIHFMVKRFS